MNERLRFETDLEIRAADLDHVADQQALLQLLDEYAQEPIINGQSLPRPVREQLIPALRQEPHRLILLAFVQHRPAGLAICFRGFSTFRARPLLNIHDLAVSKDYRGRGIGRALLESVQAEAERLGCCRLTLEVREDNHAAQHLYRQLGFDGGTPGKNAVGFWTKELRREEG